MRWDRFWRGLDAVMDAIIWGWDMLMMYVAALFLFPLCVIASLKVMGIATVWSAFAAAGVENVWFRLLLLGAPLWLAAALYARFGRSQRAAAFYDQLERLKWAVIWMTCGGMVMFAILALMFGV